MKFFDNLLKNEKSIVNCGLTSELKTIYTYNKFIEKDKNILYVTNTLYESTMIYQSISNYTDNVLFFPMDDFLTSEALAISPEFEITRIETLTKLLENKKYIVITNLMGLLRYLPEKKLYKNSFINLKKNEDYKINELINKFYNIGYKRESVVYKTGEMAVRGFVVDIFPSNSINPVRIEFWGDTIDSIRIFDCDNQRTLKEIEEVIINPNSEFICEKEVNEDLKKQKNLPNYTKVVSIKEYIDDPIIIFDGLKEINNAYLNLKEEIENYNTSLNIPKNTKYMNDLNNINYEYCFENFDENLINVKNTKNYNSYGLEPFSKNIDLINKRLNTYIRENTVIICLSNRYQINKLIENLNNSNIVVTNEENIINRKINLIIKNINNGFIYNNYIVISENEIFNRKNQNQKYKSNFKYGSKIKDITKLNIGDYVVHNIHGIGRYNGLKTLEKQGIKKDYIVVEYKDNDKLYIPVEKIELITKYSSNDSIVPKINKLGGTEWAKTKLRVRKKIEDIASKLLELYAKREASVGFSFLPDSKEQEEFDNEFKYEETSDQLRVIDEIKSDMESNHPMDRLLCGDVGYGKTEVAFRAMFKAVLSGKQVAYLCPTTILSNQHYENALERFKNYPVNIEVLNRFVSAKKTKEVLEGLKSGIIDIVIGTHRILSDDVEFKDLGLLVIDEEQRFGVKHKEKIKQYKNNIDILTLSATPIPRTLQMSMAGIRSLSLIETPPVNRYPVQTYVLEENDVIIKDAIYKELSRQGQIFILYNRVEDMNLKLERIKKLVPESRILMAHGKMTKTELEEVMFKFINKEADILLCTTIIETGIDIPNVNTLLILDADHFGLSQLYQIRGRVGRSNKIAYCYLMYSKGKNLTEIATKRLNVIKEFTELGSGFSIAMRDLSIRGAGDILGSEQAGFIDTIGIELYLNMLNEEVNKLKGVEFNKNETEEKPLLDVETSISDNYIDDIDLKIEIHKKINTIDSYKKLHDIKEEIEDRFGKINENMLIYMYEEWFEKLAHELNINKVRQTKNFVEITLDKELTNKVNGELLFMYATDISRMFRFSMKFGMLTITLDTVKLEKHFIYYLIELMEVIKKAVQ